MTPVSTALATVAAVAVVTVVTAVVLALMAWMDSYDPDCPTRTRQVYRRIRPGEPRPEGQTLQSMVGADPEMPLPYKA